MIDLEAPAVTYAFAFDGRMRPWARLFRVTPSNSSVTATTYGLEIRFGPWQLKTPWSNVSSAEARGPYRLWKVAGPARLSLRDRGITFATNTRRGLCLTFRNAVPALDPFGIVTHPNATITVEDPDSLSDEVRRRVRAAPHQPNHLASPRSSRGTVRRSLSSLRRWARRTRSVDVRSRDVDDLLVTPAADDTKLSDGQPISTGTGAWFHRRYLIRLRHSTIDAAAAMDAIRTDLNVLVDNELAPFSKLRGVHGQLAVGDRYIVEIAGPWSGPVEVTDVSDHSFRLATLNGHMEAGLIEFAVAESGDEVEFSIETWNRSAGRVIDALYDHLSIAHDLQSEMWVQACERFEQLTGGTRTGPVSVDTERAQQGRLA